jgi:hypothetical protein
MSFDPFEAMMRWSRQQSDGSRIGGFFFLSNDLYSLIIAKRM